MDDETVKMLQSYGLSEEDLTVAAEYISKAANLAAIAIDELRESIMRVMNALRGPAAEIEEFSLAAYDAAERAAYLHEERKRWGHPPKKPCCGYKSPVRAVRPCARSCIRQTGNRRRA